MERDSEDRNPFSDERVIETIFSFLDVQELKKCRFVKKFWNYQALDILLQKTHFGFRSMTRNEIVCCQVAHSKGLTRTPINYIFSFSPIHMIYTRRYLEYYSLYLDSLSFPPLEDIQLLKFPEELNFFMAMCRNLISLNLNTVPKEIYELDSIYLDPSYVLKSGKLFPCLKKLSISGMGSYKLQWLKDLFDGTFFLEQIRIVGGSEELIDNLLIIFNSKIKFRRLKDLQFVKINCLKEKHLKGLAKASIPLEILHFEDLPPITNIGMKYFEKLLSSKSKSLKELRFPNFINNNNVESPLAFFPLLPKLTKLYVEHWNTLGPIFFISNLPNLKVLHLELTQDEKNYKYLIPGNKSVYNSVRELRFPQLNFNDNEAIIKLLKVFPELKELACFCDDKILNFIFTNNSKLESLEMYSSSIVTDSGICGFNELVTSNELLQKMASASPESYKVNANITSLTELKRLSINTTTKNINNVSIHFGVSKLRNLTYLSLRNLSIMDKALAHLTKTNIMTLDLGPLEKMKITPEAIKNLQERKQYINIIFSKDKLVEEV